MLSVIIPTLNAGSSLQNTLDALADAKPALEMDIIVSDGGSGDDTLAIAESRAARIVQGPAGRGPQLAAGAGAARFDWLLFLHADTRPATGWGDAVAEFIASANPEQAAFFRFRLDDSGGWPRLIERGVAWRCRWLGLPYGDQGLLISRRFYDRLGGFRPLPLMEDVDLIRRIGRRRLAVLPVAAVTAASRYRKSGYGLRVARNLSCLGLYYLGLSPKILARLYG